MAVTTAIGAVANTLEVKIGKTVEWSLWNLDPLWKDIQTTWSQVTSNGIGQAWQVKHAFSEGLAGVIKWVSPNGPSMESYGYGGDSSPTHIVRPTAVTEYPGLDEGALPSYFQRTITLAKATGNLFVPNAYLKIEKIDGAIASLFGDIIKGASMKLALADIWNWYSRDHTRKSALGTIGSVAHTSTGVETIVLKGGAINLLYPGMYVDIYRTTTKLNVNQRWYVDTVSVLPASGQVGYGSFVIRSTDGLAMATAPAAADIIVWADSYGYGPSGPDYWMQGTTGTVYGIDVSVYTQFQSIVETSVGDLTETGLSKRLQRLRRGYGNDALPDTLLTTDGVMLAILDDSMGVSAPRFIRNLGQLNKVAYGFEDPGEGVFTYAGKQIRWMVSPYMVSDTTFDGSSTPAGGVLWGLKVRNKNIKRYVPPPHPWAKTHGAFGREIEFQFGYYGPNSIFMPYTSENGKPTDYSQAPFDKYVEYAPSDVRGLKLSGITEIL